MFQLVAAHTDGCTYIAEKTLLVFTNQVIAELVRDELNKGATEFISFEINVVPVNQTVDVDDVMVLVEMLRQKLGASQ